jgi:hypothetical protein
VIAVLNKKIIIPIIIVIIIASAIISAPYFYKKPSDDTFTQWVISGPFAIDKAKYKLGENIFISVHGLKPGEAGNILIIRPDGKTWKTIPFNGTAKSDFNYYVKPDTSAALGIYKAEDIVGEWKVVFQGVKYDPIHFEFINEFIPGAENDLIPINRNATEPTNKTETIDPTIK